MEPTTFLSQVQRSNHYTTWPPNNNDDDDVFLLGEERGEDDVQHVAGGASDEAGQMSERDAGGRLPVDNR